jgi:hypothetical protein
MRALGWRVDVADVVVAIGWMAPAPSAGAVRTGIVLAKPQSVEATRNTRRR